MSFSIDQSLHDELSRLSHLVLNAVGRGGRDSESPDSPQAKMWRLLLNDPTAFPGFSTLLEEAATAIKRRRSRTNIAKTAGLTFSDAAKQTLFRLTRYLSMYDMSRLLGVNELYSNKASARAAFHAIYTDVLSKGERYSDVTDEEREQISRIVASRSSTRPKLISQNALVLKPAVAERIEKPDDNPDNAEEQEASEAQPDVSRPVMTIYRANSNPNPATSAVPSVQKVTDLKEQALDTRDMAAELLRLRMAGLLRSPRSLAEIPLGTLAQVYGITFDKAQIAKGESTENIAVMAKNVDDNMSSEDAINLILAQREEAQVLKEAGVKSRLRAR